MCNLMPVDISDVSSLFCLSSFSRSPCVSLWVGNVTAELTEKHLLDLFKTYGEIDSIRVLHERFCAFVNFKNANMASRAMEKLNVSDLHQMLWLFCFLCLYMF